MVLEPLSTPQETPCSYHPGTMTLLRCSRCGKPICPKCAVQTQVGMRCPDCAGVRALPTYRTETGSLVKALGGGLIVALVVAVVWGYFPNWGFYLALALGFGVAETMAKLAGNKRGMDLMLIGWGMVILGLVVSRAVLANRLGLSLADIPDLTSFGRQAMYLEVVPDGLFALLPLIIVYIRFR